MKYINNLWIWALVLISIGCLSSCQSVDEVIESPKSELEKFIEEEHSKGNFVVIFENEDGSPIDYETATKVLWSGTSASYPYRTKVEASPRNWCNSTYYYVKFKGGDQTPTYYTDALTSSSGNYNITDQITKDYTVEIIRGFNVTVSGGTGGGLCDAGQSVSITANDAPSGKTFEKWTISSGSGTFASATSPSTTFQPTATSTVMANYKSTSSSSSWNSVRSTDGVYGIKSDGSPISYNEAMTSSETLTGVAIVLRGKAYQISNYSEESNWDLESEIIDVSAITNCTTVDGTNEFGYLQLPNGTYDSDPHLNPDHTQWANTPNTALADIAGLSHTEAVISKGLYIGLRTQHFRNGGQLGVDNQGFSDWFVPAAGQLAYICLNMGKINDLLNSYGAGAFLSTYYWSSTEYDADHVWAVHFGNGYMQPENKFNTRRVRFLREIKD